MVLDLLVDGVTFGLLLSLLGVGITLIFGLGEILNLAHGEFAVISAVLASVLLGMGADLISSALLSLVFVGLIGLAVERLLLFPIYHARGETRILMGIFMTLGLSLAIDSYLVNTLPEGQLSVRLPFQSILIGGASLRPSSLISAAIAISTLITLALFLKTTCVGRAIRTVAQNETGALLCGVNPATLRTLIFALGAVMAGLAGILYGLMATVTTASGFQLTIFGLIVAIVGGVRSVYGTVVSGILLGIVQSFSSFFFGAYTSLVIFLLVVILTILARPEGILGG